MATWLLLLLLLLLLNAHLLLSSTAVAEAVSAAAFVPRVGVESDLYTAVLPLQPSTVCYLRTVANMLSLFVYTCTFLPHIGIRLHHQHQHHRKRPASCTNYSLLQLCRAAVVSHVAVQKRRYRPML